MTSPIQGMIQTILTIKQIQNQDAARALAERQFGLSEASTTEQVTSGLRALASSLPDPKVLLPHVQQLADRTGLPGDLLTDIFSNAAPSVDTTRSAAVARGARSAGTSLDQPAASVAITGQTPGGLQSDALQEILQRGAQDYYNTLTPERQQGFNAAVLTRVGKGQTMGEALQDELFAALPEDQQQEAIKIGKGLAPSADSVIQGRLGAARLKLEENSQAAESAARQLQLQIAQTEADARLTGTEHDKVINILKAISDQQEFMARNSGTFTPEGQVQQNAALNSFYAELRKIAPSVGAIFEDLPLDKTVTATSPFGAFMQKVRQKP